MLTLIGAWLWWRRRNAHAEPPLIERPVVAQPSPDSPGDVAPVPPQLTLQANALKLSRSMMNATLHYRLSVTNRSTTALGDLMVGGDLVSAHNGKALSEQVAGVEQALPVRHRIERISPGQTKVLEGTLQLPLTQVHPIRQGSALLLVPLMRWQLAGADMEPLACTFVVGTLSQVAGGRLQPFRLDEQPQDYSPIGQRLVD